MTVTALTVFGSAGLLHLVACLKTFKRELHAGVEECNESRHRTGCGYAQKYDKREIASA